MKARVLRGIGRIGGHTTLTGMALSRIASRSSTGAIVVGGGMIAKTLYDRRQAKKAQARGDAELLEKAAED